MNILKNPKVKTVLVEEIFKQQFEKELMDSKNRFVGLLEIFDMTCLKLAKRVMSDFILDILYTIQLDPCRFINFELGFVKL